jgi:putative ABC transport system permease protein
VRRHLQRALAAELRAAPALLALSVLGVALGVGSVLSIRILDRGALGAFEGTVRAIGGDAALTVLGNGPTFGEEAYPAVLAEPGVAGAVPLTRTWAAVEEASAGAGEPLFLEVLGVDLLAPVRLPWQGGRVAVADALVAPGWVAVTPELAAERGWGPGTELRVAAGSRRVALRVGAIVDFRRVSPLASRRLAVMDVAQAQAAFGLAGRLHQVDVLLAAGAEAADVARRLEDRLGPGLRAATPEQRVAEASGLLAAFRLNLTALSLISLFVGGFLVHGSVQAALVRRREELGLLRSLGATRSQVLGLVLGETAVVGAAGTALGLPLGWLAARAELAGVSATVQNLYLLEGIEGVALTPGLVLLAAGLGLAGALAGALLPALDVARRDPRALLASLTLEERATRGAGPLLAAALAAPAASALAYAALGPARPWAGFLVALGILAALPLAAPMLVRALGARGRGRRLSLGWGARSLSLHLRSSSVAVGALAVAVAMLTGITVMVASFRGTVERWLDATIRADVYVTTPAWRLARGEATLSREALDRLEGIGGVRQVDRLRQTFVRVGERRVAVVGVQAGLPGGEARVRLVAGDGAEALGRVERGEALVSEPLARREGLRAGGALRIEGPRGPVELPVAGVYRDYGSESGAILLDLSAFALHFGAGEPSSAALYLAPGRDPERFVDRARAELSDEALVLRSNRSLRADVLAIFEQTFAVTRLLQAMGLLVAVSGVVLTLLTAARERRAEVALYRALGATRVQAFRVFAGKGLGIAAMGVGLGLPGGAALAWVLVRLVNRDFFGWTLDLGWPAALLAAQSAAILVAGLAASLVPALRASDAPAAELSRDAL